MMWFVVVVILLVLAIAAALVFKPQLRVIPQDERQVICRSKRFHRIAGPGPALLLAGIERIRDTYDASNQPVNIIVSNELGHGISAKISLSMWLRTDLLAVVDGDRKELAKLAGQGETARRQQVEAEVEHALTEQLKPLAPSDRLLAINSGSLLCEQLLQALSRELPPKLREHGVIMDPDHAISIRRVEPSADIIQALSSSGVVDSANLSGAGSNVDTTPEAQGQAGSSSDTPPLTPRLSHRDLQVLKRVPRGARTNQKAA